MDIKDIFSDRKTLTYSALCFAAILAILAFYHFLYSKNLTQTEPAGQTGVAEIKKASIRQLDTVIFEDDKFKNLKENKVDWPDYTSLNKGNKTPFVDNTKQ